MSFIEIQKRFLPHRSISSISSKTKMLGLYRKLNSWSEEEVSILRKYYPTMRAFDLTKKLPNRTVAAIEDKADVLGLRKKNPISGVRLWTRNEIRLLSSLYQTMRIIDIQKQHFPSETYASIKHVIHRYVGAKQK